MSKKEDKEDTGTAKKKGGGMVMKLVFGLVLLAAGGGGVFGLMAAGVIGGGGEAVEEDNSPQLVKKGEEDPYSPPAEAAEDGAAYVPGEDGSEYRTVYYEFEGDFTSNLRNSPALVQLALAASTQRDGRVLMWLREHELAIRSQLLIDIADTDEGEFMSPEGKERLQERMVASINRVLTESEGFGGVDKVYFRSLIVQ